MVLHSLKQVRMAYIMQKERGGLGGRPPPAFANRMLTERLLDGNVIDGTPLFEAGSQGLKEPGGCLASWTSLMKERNLH